MSLLEGLLVALLVASGGALWWMKRRGDRALRAAREAAIKLEISRETAARQVLELRSELALAQAESAKQAALHDEIKRLRSKYRRLYAHYTSLAEHLEGELLARANPADSPTAALSPETRPGGALHSLHR